jgi:endonuclease I
VLNILLNNIMMKKVLYTLLFLPIILLAQAPTDYYDGTFGLTGYQLKSKVHEIISKKTITWHYGDLQDFYQETDIDHHYDYDATNSTFLLDIYSNNPTGITAYHYTKDQIRGSANAEGLGYNREHMMPQSSFNSNYPMYSDLFFVIPTDARINQLRSNYPYGISGTTNYHTFTNGSKINKNGTSNSGYTGRVYEPHAEFKGDVARSLLYFAIRYEGKLASFNFYNGTSAANDTSPLDGTEEKAFEDWYVAMLLKWHNEDPVSAHEVERNNKVFGIQKNRNPFIDHPEWVSLIWSATADTAPIAAPENLAATTVSSYFVNLSWLPSISNDIIGYKIYQNGFFAGYTANSTFTVDRLDPSTLYQFSVRAYRSNYMESSDGNLISTTTLDSDIYAKDIMITKYLEGSEDNKAIEITNKTGHAVNLNNYRLGIQFFSGSNYYFPAAYELEGKIANNETAVILNPNANFSCITNDQARFVSAAPQLTFTGSSYVELRYKSSTVDAIGTKDINNSGALGNVSLYRNSSVTQPTATFDLSQWQVYPSNYCEDIGTLAVNTFSASTVNEFSIYPNPVAGQELFVKGENLQKIQKVVIYDWTGKAIEIVNSPFKASNSINIGKLPYGVYLLKIENQSLKFIKR